MSSTQKPSTSLLREMKNHQAYASTNVRKNLDTTLDTTRSDYQARKFSSQEPDVGLFSRTIRGDYAKLEAKLRGARKFHWIHPNSSQIWCGCSRLSRCGPRLLSALCEYKLGGGEHRREGKP